MIPATILLSLSFSMPIEAAIESAVINPTPSISSTSIYGFFLTFSIVLSPYALNILRLMFIETPSDCKKMTASCALFAFANATENSVALLSDIPCTRASSKGFSITSKEDSPKRSTIFCAVTLPSPFISPLERYFFMESSLTGLEIKYLTVSNCLPY